MVCTNRTDTTALCDSHTGLMCTPSAQVVVSTVQLTNEDDLHISDGPQVFFSLILG